VLLMRSGPWGGNIMTRGRLHTVIATTGSPVAADAYDAP
jgi:hypothetical protein